MGSGSTKFGVPTNPRVEIADNETRSLKRHMVIDTPSLIKLNHGTIRYREPPDHRAPVLPQIRKPTELPHEGQDRVGKCGYFYHPRLNDFSKGARYTKEDAARFHYVQRTPTSSHGRKVFFVVGVGMPDELPVPVEEAMEQGNQQTVVEDMESGENKENEESETRPEEEKGSAKEDGEENKENGEESKENGEEKKSEAGEEEAEKRPVLIKEFRSPLIPRPHVPRANHLPVLVGRTKVICMSKGQLYFNVEFTAPVAVDVALAEARANLFRADGTPTDSKGDGSGDATEDTEKKADEDKESPEGGAKENEGTNQSTAPKTDEEVTKEKNELDDIIIEVLAAGTPPTLGVTFGPAVTVGAVRDRLSEQLDISPPKINLVHEDKYVSSHGALADLALGELQEGFRHRVLLTPI